MTNDGYPSGYRDGEYQCCGNCYYSSDTDEKLSIGESKCKYNSDHVIVKTSYICDNYWGY